MSTEKAVVCSLSTGSARVAAPRAGRCRKLLVAPIRCAGQRPMYDLFGRVAAAMECTE